MKAVLDKYTAIIWDPREKRLSKRVEGDRGEAAGAGLLSGSVSSVPVGRE